MKVTIWVLGEGKDAKFRRNNTTSGRQSNARKRKFSGGSSARKKNMHVSSKEKKKNSSASDCGKKIANTKKKKNQKKKQKEEKCEPTRTTSKGNTKVKEREISFHHGKRDRIEKEHKYLEQNCRLTLSRECRASQLRRRAVIKKNRKGEERTQPEEHKESHC